MNLYELTADLQQVYAAINAGDGELSDDLVTKLDNCELAFETKLENVAKVLSNLAGEEAAFKAEIARLTARKKTVGNTIDRLKEYAKEALAALGKDKMTCGLFKFAIQKNNPSVKVEHEELVPPIFWVQPPLVIDKKTVLTALKVGICVPGCELSTDNTHLRIR